jgi:8-oxo-dGTP pyrophosphatase MutT (NUDIX family)
MPHIHEKYDFVVSVFIVFKDKVLLVHHPRYHKWLPIGGHIELDEDPEQALYREIEEESGLEVEILSSRPPVASDGIKPLLTPEYVDVHDANLPHRHIGLIYFAKATNEHYRLSSEHLEMKWLGLNDLSRAEYALPKSIIFYCQQALHKASLS